MLPLNLGNYPKHFRDRMKIKLFKEPVVVGKNKTMLLVGRVQRQVRYSQRNFPDYDFVRFCESRGIIVDRSKYDIAHGSIHAGMKSFSKYDRLSPHYDAKSFAQAGKMLTNSYACLPRARLLPGYRDAYDGTTSAGYPWNLLYPNKREAKKSHDLDRYIDNFVRTTSYMPTIAGNTIKEEPKKTAKIEIDDLRSIVAMSMEMTAKGNYLFGDMNEKMYQFGREQKLSSIVGLSKYRLGWERLFNRLNRHPNALDYDFKAFDGSVDEESISMVMTVRLGLYSRLTPNLINLVKSFYTHIVWSLVVLEDGFLVMKSTGQPSGQVNTITDNSMVNEFRWLYAWCVLAPDDMKNFHSWKLHVEAAFVGDDSIITVSDACAKWFTPERISEVFASQGWGSKGTSLQYRSIFETEFCSLKFERRYGHIVPVLAHPDKVLVSLAFGSKYEGIAYSCLRALAIRTEVFWNQDLFDLLDGYINCLFENHHAELSSHPEIKYDDLCSMRKSNVEILDLYLVPDSR